MFAAALDAVLAKLKLDPSIDFSLIEAVSGCGQQHGSIFWRNGARDSLSTLDPALSLSQQLQHAFAIENAPIWMDSSSTKWCHKLEHHVGGPTALANLTGSRAYERFTGNQIAKIIETNPIAFESCERISLVSSMMTCLFSGGYIGIDESDASGMNLLDIRTKRWVPEILECVAGGKFTGEHLARVLGDPVAPNVPVGCISPYFVARYGFSPTCQVVPFTGDNPSSLAGLGISQPGDLAVSLGTSDTAFAVLDAKDCKPNGKEGHVLVNPVDPNTAILMLCFKNGSLAREEIKHQTCPTNTWTEFSTLLNSTPPGNTGHIGFFHPLPEITPPTLTPATHVFAAGSNTPIPISQVPKAVLARAIVESHCLRIREHTRKLGLKGVKRVIVTGGASANESILQVLADVVGVSVYRVNLSLGGARGGALGGVGWGVWGVMGVGVEVGVVVCCVPREECGEVYEKMGGRFGELEGLFV
ncbi:hypothetical protein HDU98_001481 [Podochytrium sp. JEL0797]|nr:hypothetical protein HDU98_001481 [Podochytrium sp. JEL0797]